MTLDIDEAKVGRAGPGLWLGWTLATALGLLLGFVPFALFLPQLNAALVRVLLPLLAGLLVGLFQWVALRPYLTRPVDWVLSGGAGWALGFALGLLIMHGLAGSPLGALLGYLAFGLMVALLQWPVLRREIPNAWAWVVASVVGWAAGAYLAQLALRLLPASAQANLLLTTALTALVTGLVAGAITGLALVVIGRRPDLTPAPTTHTPAPAGPRPPA